jgi:hypothetical protein
MGTRTHRDRTVHRRLRGPASGGDDTIRANVALATVQWSANGWHDLGGIAGPFRSLYNRRSHTAYVHEVDQNQPEFCVDPQEQISNMNTAYNHARWLYLASSQTACG